MRLNGVFQAPEAPWLREKEMNRLNSFQPVKFVPFGSVHALLIFAESNVGAHSLVRAAVSVPGGKAYGSAAGSRAAAGRGQFDEAIGLQDADKVAGVVGRPGRGAAVVLNLRR